MLEAYELFLGMLRRVRCPRRHENVCLNPRNHLLHRGYICLSGKSDGVDGGEEFTILLSNTPIHSAVELAERLRVNVDADQRY